MSSGESSTGRSMAPGSENSCNAIAGEVSISSPWADTGTPSALQRLAVEKGAPANDQRYRLVPGEWMGFAIDLLPDADGKGFTLDSRRVSGVHYKRVGKT